MCCTVVLHNGVSLTLTITTLSIWWSMETAPAQDCAVLSVKLSTIAFFIVSRSGMHPVHFQPKFEMFSRRQCG